MRKFRGQNLGPIIADALKQIHKALKEFLANDLWSEFPTIEDFTEEGLERRRLEALRKIVKRRRKLGPGQMLKIFTLKKEGESSRQIAKELGCSHTIVLRVNKKVHKLFQDEGLL
jgi:hypothetical protein